MWILKLVTCCCIFQYVCGINVVLTNFTQCGQPMQYISLNCGPPKNGVQYCDLVHKSPVENGENFPLKVNLEILRGKRWRKLVNIEEQKGFCGAVELYLRNILDHVLESANEPKHCPLRKGTISVKNVKFDFSSITFPLPKGRIRAFAKSHEKTSGKLGTCLNIEVESS